MRDVLLEDFLGAMDDLQADFRRKLSHIEDQVPPTAKGTRSRGGFASESGEFEKIRRQLGLEAIWTDARGTVHGTSETSEQSSFASAHHTSRSERPRHAETFRF
ncbi:MULTISPECIES: hypothetical protein [unclassified Streptomyces]|uniref:hypothetical protein n=1 Tax=unclassified Streptomyces TaxID=2593676 RepID=UPI0006FF388C|nr:MULTISPECIES: hypothetical protein [unclassified Streptomyces]KQX50683.1 hypothetical protein ASD33_11495 [Streptomyces sp. Root1304]KRA84847.1 hypothetical protein ASE09_11500 [Streptomyces sp. Root66D1]